MTSFTAEQAKIAEILRQVEQASLQLATVCNVAVNALSQMSQEQTFNNAQQHLISSMQQKKLFVPTNGHMQQSFAFGSYPVNQTGNFGPVRFAFSQNPVQFSQAQDQTPPPAPATTTTTTSQGDGQTQAANENSSKTRAQTTITVEDVVEYIKAGRKQTGQLVKHFNLPPYVVRGLAKRSKHLSFDADGFWNYSEQPAEKVAPRTAADVLAALQKKNGEAVKTSALAHQLNLHPKILNKLALEAGCITTDDGHTWKAPTAASSN